MFYSHVLVYFIIVTFTSISALPSKVIAQSEEKLECGQPIYDPNVLNKKRLRTRIVGGNSTRPHSWPWMVRLYIETPDGRMRCGGTLIDPENNGQESSVVLTAGHCVVLQDETVVNPKNIEVLLGAHNIDKNEDEQIEVSVITVKPHEKYNTEPAANNDFALLKLNQSIKFNDFIRPVCLPLNGETPVDPDDCYATGWGLMREYPDIYSPDMQQAKMPILSDETCGHEDVWDGVYLPDKMICAGYLDGSKNICSGDSGGPLVCKNKNDKWTQFGVNSFVAGEGCSVENRPGGFARVNSYTSWIVETALNLQTG